MRLLRYEKQFWIFAQNYHIIVFTTETDVVSFTESR